MGGGGGYLGGLLRGERRKRAIHRKQPVGQLSSQLSVHATQAALEPHSGGGRARGHRARDERRGRRRHQQEEENRDAGHCFLKNLSFSTSGIVRDGCALLVSADLEPDDLISIGKVGSLLQS